MSKRKLTFEVTIPYVPDHMTIDYVEDWLRDRISHPHDAFFEAFVKVDYVKVELTADMPAYNEETGEYEDE